MKAFLNRRWFLILLVTGLGVALLRPEWLRGATDLLAARTVVAVALFLMAWSLESRSLVRSVLRPAPALWATLVSYAFVPGLAWAVGWIQPHVDFRIGLMISACVPCTLASAILWTRMAGGNEATVLLVILLTTCTSWLATPAWLTLLGGGNQASVDTSAMMSELFLVLVLPTGIGQLCRAIGPLLWTATRHKKAIGVCSQLLVFSIMLKAAVIVGGKLGDDRVMPGVAPLVGTVALSVGTHTLALLSGFWSSYWLRFDRPSQIAVAFASSQKTLPVALFLFERYYQDHPLAVVSIVAYHVGQLVVDTFIADSLSSHPTADPTIAQAEMP